MPKPANHNLALVRRLIEATKDGRIAWKGMEHSLAPLHYTAKFGTVLLMLRGGLYGPFTLGVVEQTLDADGHTYHDNLLGRITGYDPDSPMFRALQRLHEAAADACGTPTIDFVLSQIPALCVEQKKETPA